MAKALPNGYTGFGVILTVQAGKALFNDQGKMIMCGPSDGPLFTKASKSGLKLVNANTETAKQIQSKIPNFNQDGISHPRDVRASNPIA